VEFGAQLKKRADNSGKNYVEDVVYVRVRLICKAVITVGLWRATLMKMDGKVRRKQPRLIGKKVKAIRQ
jgi:hypothetical protein